MGQNGTFERLHVSAPFKVGQAAESVNECCHTLTSGVRANAKHCMRKPRVMLVLWGHYYETDADARAFSEQLIADLVTGPFMNNLCQYGVGRGSLLGTAVFDTGPQDPAPVSLDLEGVKTQLKNWIDSGCIPKPGIDEADLLYLIFPPTTTKLVLGALTDSDFSGYHDSDKYNQQSTDDDLFFAIVSTRVAGTDSGQMFATDLGSTVSHELAEAFTDRDGKGFISDVCKNSDGQTVTCEIGDICERRGPFYYRKPGSQHSWSIEQYWSNWDRACVYGASPVSLRKFLSAINFDVQNRTLRSLGTQTIDLEFMASSV